MQSSAALACHVLLTHSIPVPPTGSFHFVFIDQYIEPKVYAGLGLLSTAYLLHERDPEMLTDGIMRLVSVLASQYFGVFLVNRSWNDYWLTAGCPQTPLCCKFALKCGIGMLGGRKGAGQRAQCGEKVQGKQNTKEMNRFFGVDPCNLVPWGVLMGCCGCHQSSS